MESNPSVSPGIRLLSYPEEGFSMKWMWVDRQVNRIANIGMWVAVGCLLVMVLLINVEVIVRYGFNTSTLISDEYSAYLFVGCSFLGFAYAFRKGHFLRVNTLTARLSPFPSKCFQLATLFLAMLFSAILTYELIKLPYTSYLFHSKSIQPSATPLFIPQLILPIGMASMTLSFLNDLVLTLLRKAVLPQGGTEKEVG
jgi:TRAP-type C4-dicarboxylate transport system permease small subunit